MKTNQKIAIIIPNYGEHIDDTIKSVESIIRTSYQNKIIIIVDDGSPTDIPNRLKEAVSEKYSEIFIKLLSENREGNTNKIKYLLEWEK